MKTTDLKKHGFPDVAINAWRNVGRTALFPLQQQAIELTDLLKGRNLCIFAPTSSGKTFTFEMAAVRQWQKGNRTIIIVPTRPLANEHYLKLTATCGAMDMRVTISTAEHRYDEWNIARGNYDLAVMVPEKLKQFIWTTPGFLNGIGLVIIDELQILCDPERGGNVQLILRDLLRARPSLQIITATGVVHQQELLLRYLRAKSLITNLRPVEMRLGVFDRWTAAFIYREQNSGKEGVEDLGIPDPQTPQKGNGKTQDKLLPAAQHLCRRFTAANEQTLIFVPKQRTCRTWAEHIADTSSASAAEKALKELRKLPKSRLRDQLESCLKHGVAFHFGGLPRDMRRIVEQGVNTGEIMVVVATSTLAQGVNLQVHNVILYPLMSVTDPDGHWKQDLLSYEDLINKAGRCARTLPGLNFKFGRAILLPFEPGDIPKLQFRYSEIPEISLQFEPRNETLQQMVLDLIAGDRASSDHDVVTALNETWMMQAMPEYEHPQFERKVRGCIDKLIDDGILVRVGQSIQSTPVGRCVSLNGIEPGTGSDFLQWCLEWKERTAAAAADIPHDMEILTLFAMSNEGSRFSAGNGKRVPDTIDAGHFRLKYDWALTTVAEPLHTPLSGAAGSIRKLNAALRKAELANSWISAASTQSIEEDFDQFDGLLEALGNQFGWLATGLTGIAECAGCDADLMKRLRAIALRLPNGLPEGAEELGRIYRPELTREQLLALHHAGLVKVEALADAEPEKLTKILPLEVAVVLVETAEQLLAAAAEKADVQSKPGSTDQIRPTAIVPPRLLAQNNRPRPRTSVRAASAGYMSAVETPDAAAPGEVIAPTRGTAEQTSIKGEHQYILVMELKDQRVVILNGHTVKLTRGAWDLLSYLARHPGEIVSNSTLANKVWYDDGIGVPQIRAQRNNIVKAFMPILGKKAAEDLIKRVWGTGLVLNLKPNQILLK